MLTRVKKVWLQEKKDRAQLWCVREDPHNMHHFGKERTLYLASKVNPNITRGCPHGVMVKAMDCGIVVSEFVIQSDYYVHFRANTLRKGMNPLILPAMG